MQPCVTLSQRLWASLDGIRQAAAVEAARYWAIAPTVLLLYNYLARTFLRFERLLARYEAGRLAVRPAAVRPAHPSPAPPPPITNAARLLRTPGWLGTMVPNSRVFGHQLQHLLSDPRMQELLAAAPQLGRLLRPVFRMLGQDPPPPIAVPPRPATPPRASAPPPAAPAIDPFSDRFATT